jgi:hypothetical protein
MTKSVSEQRQKRCERAEGLTDDVVKVRKEWQSYGCRRYWGRWPTDAS